MSGYGIAPPPPPAPAGPGQVEYGWTVAVAVIILVVSNILCWLPNENVVKALKRAKRSTLVVTNRAVGVPHSQRPSTIMCYELLDANDLFHNGYISALPLALFRFFGLVIFITITVIMNKSGQAGLGGGYFKNFTNWTWTLWGMMHTSGTIMTARAWWDRRREQRKLASTAGEGAAVLQQTRMPLHCKHKFLLLLIETVTSSSIMLTIFYWVAVYNKTQPWEFTSAFQHGVNCLIMLIDIVVSRVPLVSYHLWVPMLYGTVYMVFMWVFWAITGEWVYSALDWNTPINLVYYFVLPLLLAASYAFMMLVGGFRAYRQSGKFCMLCACCAPHCACCAPHDDEEEGSGSLEGGEGKGVGQGPAIVVVAPPEVQMAVAN